MSAFERSEGIPTGHPYRCRGCERGFDGYGELRAHQGKCTRFRGGQARERGPDGAWRWGDVSIKPKADDQ